MSVIDRARASHQKLTAIRRDIHAHPEMGMEEVRTAALVATKLREWGIEVTEGVGKTGVVGTVKGKLPGQRAIGLRADMDALAIPEATGLPYVIFRNSWYFENLLPSLPQTVSSRQWFTSAGEGRTAYVARDDLAQAIAAVLAAPVGDSLTYTLTGDEALTNGEIAALVSQISGREIALVAVSDAELAAGLEKAGLPAPVAALLASFDANTRAGRIAAVKDDLRKLIGRAPARLEDFLRANKAAYAA